MTREHIFRGKSLDNGEWVIGDLVHVKGGALILPIGKGWDQHRVDPETVGQFTGIKDKNGVDIYEDDIIECIDSHGEPVRHFVEFCERRGYYAQYIIDGGKMFIWNRNQEAGGISQSYIYECGKYVIGNIYDNPELLKTE